MKLAEALQERADLNRLISQLEDRLDNNALAQEGEDTAESPATLKAQLDSAVERLEHLIGCINHTNCATFVDGMSLTQIIARKDTLSLKLRVYKNTITEASRSTYRARNTEIKIKPTISVLDWRHQADQMAKELRLLDNTLQKCNWDTELIEE